MDQNRNNPRDVTPHRPNIGTPAHRPMQRPVFSDFTTRPASRPTRPHAPHPSTTAPQPVATPASQPAAPTVLPLAAPVQPNPPVQPQHQVVPHHKVHAPAPQPVAAPTVQPAAQARPTAPGPQLDGFLRPAAAATPTAVTPPQPAVHHAPTPAPQPVAAAAPLAPAVQPTAPSPESPPVAPLAEQPVPAHAPLKKVTKTPRARSENAHAGLVGLVLFVVLTALFTLPLLPGKVLDNFPGSSASFSTGDQAIGCVDQLENQHTSTSYDSKAGFPITYRYATSTHQTATCSGNTQSAVTGHTSQFNPLGLLINIVSAFALAIIVGKVWGKIFGHKD